MEFRLSRPPIRGRFLFSLPFLPTPLLSLSLSLSLSLFVIRVGLGEGGGGCLYFHATGLSSLIRFTKDGAYLVLYTSPKHLPGANSHKSLSYHGRIDPSSLLLLDTVHHPTILDHSQDRRLRRPGPDPPHCSPGPCTQPRPRLDSICRHRPTPSIHCETPQLFPQREPVHPSVDILKRSEWKTRE